MHCCSPAKLKCTLKYNLDISLFRFFQDICDVLRDMVPFVQYKKREKHPWRRLKPATLQKVKLVLRWCFSRFLSRTKIPNRAQHHINLNFNTYESGCASKDNWYCFNIKLQSSVCTYMAEFDLRQFKHRYTDYGKIKLDVLNKICHKI